MSQLNILLLEIKDILKSYGCEIIWFNKRYAVRFTIPSPHDNEGNLGQIAITPTVSYGTIHVSMYPPSAEIRNILISSGYREISACTAGGYHIGEKIEKIYRSFDEILEELGSFGFLQYGVNIKG